MKITRSTQTDPDDDMDAIIQAGERKLVHTVALVLGFSYLLLFSFGLETRWYGWGLLVAFSSFCGAIVWRWLNDLKDGKI